MNMSLGNIRYNAQLGAFEGRVDIEKGDATYRYPCQVNGPLTMDMDQVHKRMKHQALHMSDSGTNLMSHF